MLVAERRAEILRRIEAHGSVRVGELSAYFGVTEETIRRDLEELERQKLVARTYGGAVRPTGTGFELPYTKRREKNAAEKARIAKAAAQLISDGDTICLDASTTALRMCQELQHIGRLTVLTNSIHALIDLATRPGIHVIGTGGAVRETALSFVGPLAERAIEEHHVDRVFISGRGITLEKGLTDSNELEVELKKRMVHAARQVVVLVDHTKFGYIGFARVLPVSEIDVLITDSGADPDEIARFRKAGVEVIVA